MENLLSISRNFDHFKRWFFSISCIYVSPADLLIFVSDKIARAFARSGATQAVTLDISKALNRLSEVLSKFKSYRILCQVLSLILLFLVIEASMSFWMKSYHTNMQLMLVLLKAVFLLLHCSYRLITLMILSWVFLSITKYTTVYSHCDQASNVRQHL